MACYPGQPEDLRAREGRYDDKSAMGYEVEPQHPLKSHSTRAIIKWLEDTYQYEDCICLPRSTIYEHYSDFCGRNHLQPVNAASFGKIIRQQFPSLTTRRLGTRGQSKYHYYGLGIKPTSIYYTEDYVLKQQNQGVPKKEPEAKKTHAYYAAKERPSAVLPKFPEVKNLTLSDSLPKHKLTTFMVMYRAHCQRILDSVVRANFDEVENFLLHFWQAMPPHLVPVLDTELVVDLVAVCDMALYKAIVSIYIATPLQNIPDNVAHEVRRFTNNLKFWLEPALRGLPEQLITVKLKAADMLCKSFKRQRSLMHLADAARNAFKGEESIEQLESDWCGLNLQTIFAQTLYTIQPLNVPQRYLDMVPNFLAEFSCMFSDEKCSLEDFALWVEAVMDNCFKDLKKGSLKLAGKTFLLTWKFFTSKVVREFTLMSAPSFGTFHLLHMLVDDYIMHTLETMLEKEYEEAHLSRINLLRKDDAEVEDTEPEEGFLPTNSTTAAPNVAAAPADSLPLSPDEYPPFVAQGNAEFKHSMSAQDCAPPTDVISRGGGGMESKVRKTDYSSELMSFHNRQDSNSMMNELSMPPGMAHGAGIVSETPASASKTFQSMQDSSNLSGNLQSRYPPMMDSEEGHTGPLSRSLSHPNLNSVSPTPRGTSAVPAHSQAPSIPFPANLGGFTLSSMVGHYSQLQPQSLSMNPTAGGLMPGLGLSVGSTLTQPPTSITQSLTLPNTSQPLSTRLLTGATSNAPISLPPSGTRSTLPPSTSLPMPLTHPIAANLQNPSVPPLIPGMPNMYSYPYATPLPVTSSSTNAPIGFPPQSLVPQGYSQYLPPSLYNNAPQQPPVSTGNFSR